MIPANGDEAAEQALNRFLRSHRVIQVDRHYDSNISRWVILVEWVEGDVKNEDSAPMSRRGHADPTEGMTTSEAARFEQMRKIRRELADARGVPPYVIFNNKELTMIASLPRITAESVATLRDIPAARLKANIQSFIDFDEEQNREPQTELQNTSDETSRETDASDLPF